MLQRTNGIVLRSVKYGETSLVTTIFTQVYGIQAYMVQGVRSSSMRQNKAANFQPGTLLELVVYQQPQKNMQRIREFSPAYVYTTLHENVIRNSILLFSVELLFRLLPEQAPLPELFEFANHYFITLDKATDPNVVANMPLYLTIRCSDELGFELKGAYSKDTPYLNLQEGGYTDHPPAAAPFTTDEDARLLDALQHCTQPEDLQNVPMNAEQRMRLIDWYVAFLQQHTQHMSSIRSLPVLRSVLH